MPTRLGHDSEGCYAQWGNSGKRYRYECGNKIARDAAIKKANKQGQAAHAAGYKESYQQKNVDNVNNLKESIIDAFKDIIKGD